MRTIEALFPSIARRPQHLATGTAWPLMMREYGASHPAREGVEKQRTEPLNADWTSSDFGAYGKSICQRYDHFKGDWWLFTLLHLVADLTSDAKNPELRPVIIKDINFYLDKLRENKVSIRLDHARFVETNLGGINLSDANLSRANLFRSKFEYAQLRDVNSDGSRCSHAVFRGADLRRAKFVNTNLQQADFVGSDICDAVFETCDLSHANLTGVDFQRSRLIKSNLGRAGLVSACLRGKDLSDFNFEAADLSSADLVNSHLVRAKLAGANLSGANCERADLSLAVISGVKMAAASFAGARGLFGPGRASDTPDPVVHIEAQKARFRYSWEENWLCRQWSWESLRFIAGLRLFGVSYAAVVAIVLYSLLARWHNTRFVEMVAEVASKSKAVNPLLHGVALRLPQLPVPWHLGTQLLATFLVAAAATVFQLRCPDEIKEATEVHWTRSMSQPLWEYRAASWAYPRARYVCAVLFLLGGSYSIIYIGYRAIFAVLYLFRMV